MNIIKQENLNHEIFKAYDNFTNILEIFRFEEPDGYMIIRRSGTNFAIDFFGVSPLLVNPELKEILVPYFKGDLFISMNEQQDELKEYIKSQKMVFWFSSYDMITDSMNEMTEGKLVPYKGELERYIHIFGKAFLPLRTELGFETPENFAADPEYAKNIFEETNQVDSFYGYEVEGKIVGAAYAFGNEVESIAVDPEYQGKGYGKQLLRGCVSDMLTKHKTVSIGVVEINRKAHKLYESVGFKVTSYRHNYKNFVE